MTDWQLVFQLSRANGAENNQDDLAVQKIDWPRGWMTKRLEQIRKEGLTHVDKN